MPGQSSERSLSRQRPGSPTPKHHPSGRPAIVPTRGTQLPRLHWREGQTRVSKFLNASPLSDFLLDAGPAEQEGHVPGYAQAVEVFFVGLPAQRAHEVDVSANPL